MPNYRRRRTGSLYFFTLVTQARRHILTTEAGRRALHDAMERTRSDRPWVTEAIVLLPDHLHMIWGLPEGDHGYSTRVAVLKKRFTRAWLARGGPEADVPQGQRRHRLRGVWQRRFWEHTIRDMRDFRLHVDYVHLNPVKHALASRPSEWPWSSFGRYVAMGWYEPDWCGRADLPGSVEYVCPE